MKLKGNIDKLQYKTRNSAGFDLCSTINVIIPPGEWYAVPTGVFIETAESNEYLDIRPRSGLAKNYGVTVLNSPGTIDADYKGEIGVILINHGTDEFIIEEGDSIAQGLLHVNLQHVENINISDKVRKGGYGSTGK